MIALFTLSLFAAPGNSSPPPTIKLNCEFTNRKTNEQGSFAVNPPGSLFRDYTITKGNLKFTFQLKGWIFYSMKTKADSNQDNIHIKKTDDVSWSFRNGYHLKSHQIHIDNAQIKLHCDEVFKSWW